MSHPALEGSERWKADRDQETGVSTELPVELSASAGSAGCRRAQVWGARRRESSHSKFP
jgi:hypothetical protein